MKQLLILLMLLCSTVAFAQDVIVKKDGSTVVCRVVELNETEIVYKKWSDLNGSNYVMERSVASAINYEDGKKISLSEMENLYQPNIQNDGVQNYNDRTLLKMDAEAHYRSSKKSKELRTIGWGGIIGVGLGAFSLYKSANVYHGKDYYTIAGIVLAVGGVSTATYCFMKAHKIDNEIEMYIQSSTLYQHDFEIGNGSSLSLGADLLHDNTLGQNTIGLGLRYNF